jgi:hypothetical protein
MWNTTPPSMAVLMFSCCVWPGLSWPPVSVAGKEAHTICLRGSRNCQNASQPRDTVQAQQGRHAWVTCVVTSVFNRLHGECSEAGAMLFFMPTSAKSDGLALSHS